MQGKIKGLTSEEAVASRQKHGTNALERLKGRGIIRSFFDNLNDPIIRILVFALILEVVFTLGRCNLVEVFGILSAILIATLVSTISEYGSERAFAKLEKAEGKAIARVLRDGRTVEISADDIVVGDILFLSSGEKIHADGILLSGELSVDQSALTGENVEVRKKAGTPAGWDLSDEARVFRGSVIASGDGVMRVERVGVATFYGQVARDIQSKTRESPLKLRLSRLAGQISRLGYIAAAVVGAIYLITAFFVEKSVVMTDPVSIFTTLIHALTLMITVIVVAVPEGLPMMITVVLSANMKRMLRDNLLVKKPVGIETAGSLNILFTDKTGTLTTGRLSVDRIITYNDTVRRMSTLRRMPYLYDALLLSAAYNTDTQRENGQIIGGNATDRAIADFFREESIPAATVISRTPFSSDLKYSSVTLSDATTYIKGAAEIILARTSFALDEKGNTVAFNKHYAADSLATALSAGERVIAVARSTGHSDALTLIALVVLKDKIRDGVREAVAKIESAGIQIVMLTGDNPDTAVSIARECGFYKDTRGHISLTGADMERLTDEQLKAMLPSLRVLARARPSDKIRLVRLSQELELVVGMTGDGINDAPALKLADVGFAMGSGMDIAKSAGDVVILDDSIFSISRTILYGRTIFKSIRKFIKFQLIMNLAACGITLIGQILGMDNPITIIQMLWVNIIMDTLGGLAFAGEPPLDYYMKEKPKRRDEPIITRQMVGEVLGNGIFTLGVLVAFLTLNYFKDFYLSSARHLTAFYALFIFAGLFNCLSARGDRFFIFSKIGKNKPFILIMLFIAAIQILIVYYGGTLFRSTPLSIHELGFAILTALTVLVFDTIRRIFKKLSR
ncbi:MAG: calcium-translocating P-type ATPase, PMCA-type [Clostridia bacterium]|nr:calcium-translocating P-type ATPase, PMCA-type [Clostridia bacterium]